MKVADTIAGMEEIHLRDVLRDLPIKDIHYLKRVASTNDYAAELLKCSLEYPCFVFTAEQTEGRGRMNRRWYSDPQGSLTFSLILKPEARLFNNLVLLSPLGAIAVCNAIETEFGISAQVKWPNDVLIKGKKVCGVLAEANWEGGTLMGIILGIGINLLKNSAPANQSLLFEAAGIGDFTENKPDAAAFLKQVLHQLFFWLGKLDEDEFLEYWGEHLAYKDKIVQIVEKGTPVMKGRVLGVAKDGCLKIELDSGVVKMITVGDVFLRLGGM